VRVLIACEFSGVVREEFARLGHDAMSCDLLPTEIACFGNNTHYQGDVRDLLENEWGWGWDVMIAFPPCTHLCSSGARWWPDKKREQEQALEFVGYLMGAKVPRIAIENPVGRISSAIRRPDQIIQPWQFGEGEVKTTCLWLKGLPLLRPTNIVQGREQRCWKMSPSPTRGRERSRTYKGIARAMATQWGNGGEEG
jgi:hypothetical protein